MPDLETGNVANDTENSFSNGINTVQNAYRTGRNAVNNGRKAVNSAKKAGNAIKKTAKNAGKAAKAAVMLLSNPVFLIGMSFLILCIVICITFTGVFFGGGTKSDDTVDIYDICVDYHDITPDFNGDGFEWVPGCRDEIHEMRQASIFYSKETQDDIDNGGYAWDVTDPLFNANPEVDAQTLMIVADITDDFGDIKKIDIYPSRGNDEDGYSPAVMIARNNKGQEKYIRMSSCAIDGEAYEYDWGSHYVKTAKDTWQTVAGGVYSPAYISVYQNILITSLPYTEKARNTLKSGSYQSYIDGKPTDTKCLKVSLIDLLWLYKHTVIDKTQTILHENAFDGDVPKAKLSSDSTAHYKEAMACAFLMESWIVDGKSALPRNVDWKEFGNCFTGDDFMYLKYNPDKDETWSNLENLLDIELSDSTIQNIVEIAKQIDGYVEQQVYEGDIDQLFNGEPMILYFENPDGQEMWDRIFADHYNNLSVMHSGNWDRSNPQCTDFASWRCWKQYGHGTANGNGSQVAGNLVRTYPEEFVLSRNPKSGAIFSYSLGQFGHVGYVEKVEGDIMYLSEGNAGASGSINDHSIKLNCQISISYFKQMYPSVEFANPR